MKLKLLRTMRALLLVEGRRLARMSDPPVQLLKETFSMRRLDEAEWTMSRKTAEVSSGLVDLR